MISVDEPFNCDGLKSFRNLKYKKKLVQVLKETEINTCQIVVDFLSICYSFIFLGP